MQITVFTFDPVVPTNGVAVSVDGVPITVKWASVDYPNIHAELAALRNSFDPRDMLDREPPTLRLYVPVASFTVRSAPVPEAVGGLAELVGSCEPCREGKCLDTAHAAIRAALPYFVPPAGRALPDRDTEDGRALFRVRDFAAKYEGRNDLAWAGGRDLRFADVVRVLAVLDAVAPTGQVGRVEVCEGWWHPNTNAGRVHDHPAQPGRGWSSTSHRSCERVYTHRPSMSDADREKLRREVADCTCVENCAEDPATACSLSGRLHVHPGVGFGPCPVHPDAPGDR